MFWFSSGTGRLNLLDPFFSLRMRMRILMKRGLDHCVKLCIIMTLESENVKKN